MVKNCRYIRRNGFLTGFRQWANHSEFMFMPILLAASASRKRTSQRLYDYLLQPVMKYLLA